MGTVALPNLEDKYTPEILLSMAEVQQARSNFQLDKFVINQHETDEMRYFQTLLELQSLYYTIKVVSLEMKKTEIEIERLRLTGDEIDEIDAQIKEVGLEQTRLVGIGSFRELDKLIEIYNTFSHKYTRDEIEQAQEQYWSLRLRRQSVLESVGGSQAQASHLDALRQMGALEITADGELKSVEQYREQIEPSNTKELK
jgi:hypothetical protein